MSTYAEGRKQHVSVSQDRILEVLRDLGCPAHLHDLAEFLNISVNQAASKCDGLVYQGKVRSYGDWTNREYEAIR
jgi:hypothetical protein